MMHVHNKLVETRPVESKKNWSKEIKLCGFMRHETWGSIYTSVIPLSSGGNTLVDIKQINCLESTGLYKNNQEPV